MTALRGWLLSLTGAALLSALALALTPKGAVRGVVGVLCGALMAAALFNPLLDLSYTDYAVYLNRYRAEAEALIGSAEVSAKESHRLVIEERLRAYILDEARLLGAEPGEIRLDLSWNTEGFWLPEEISLEGGYHPTLSAWLEAELGIPRERQCWGVGEK